MPQTMQLNLSPITIQKSLNLLRFQCNDLILRQKNIKREFYANATFAVQNTGLRDTCN